MVPVMSLMRAHCVRRINERDFLGARKRVVREGKGLTSTGLSPAGINMRTNSKRFKSHNSTCPSEEADNKALKERDTARVLTEVL